MTTSSTTAAAPPLSPLVTGSGIKVGYARVSTTGEDLTAQRVALAALGVEKARVYLDHGLTGTNRARPGLREALPATRAGDTLVVTKLDRLARSLADARDIADELTAKGVALNLGGSLHDPTDPIGRLLFNVLGMVAEFESDLIRTRTGEGLAVARAAGKLRGRQPKLSPRQEAHLASLQATGEHTPSDLAPLFGVGRSTVYRALTRASAARARPVVLHETGTRPGAVRWGRSTPGSIVWRTPSVCWDLAVGL